AADPQIDPQIDPKTESPATPLVTKSTEASELKTVETSLSSQPTAGPPIINPPSNAPSSEVSKSTPEPTLDGESESVGANPPIAKSWVFRLTAGISWIATRAFGITSVVLMLAIAASIPLVQLVSFGYLLEVSGRLARRQKFRSAMIGLDKASKLGGIVLGTWLTLWPVRFISELWREATLIDPTSSQAAGLQIGLGLLIAFSLLHIGSVWICGGKLRYFFWPVIAPLSFGIWLVRRFSGVAGVRQFLNWTVGWLSPRLVDDICKAPSISDWFVPAIIFRRFRAGGFYASLRDGVWNFVMGLRLDHYFVLGAKGFIGSFAWLFLPTLLLVGASYSEGGLAVLLGVVGVLMAIPIFMMLPFLQTHFALEGKLSRFLEVRAVLKNFGRAPLAHVLALLLALVFALPLFFLKIEEIPSELLWTLSVVFILFSWPARFCLGWAYRRGGIREKSSRWWIRYPFLLLAAPISFSFVLVLTLTRYVSWNGALSLFENHVFLLPAPFWM
ncbi:MAG: hypothetical protein ACI87E_004156, partial [Mariniblastus sp.]